MEAECNEYDFYPQELKDTIKEAQTQLFDIRKIHK